MSSLQKIRKIKGVSQQELADALGVTQGSISAWESGRWNPTVENLKAAALFLGVSMDELMEESDDEGRI